MKVSVILKEDNRGVKRLQLLWLKVIMLTIMDNPLLVKDVLTKAVSRLQRASLLPNIVLDGLLRVVP